MALDLNPSTGMPLDPSTVQALQQQQQMQQIQSIGGTSRERMNDATFGQATSNLFPSPEVQQARQAQSALQSAQLQQGPDESDIDFSIRQLKAQHDAIAPISPSSAMQLQGQILKLDQMRLEQSKLVAQDQRAQTEFEEGEPERQANATQAKAVGTLAYAVTPNPTNELGFDSQAYDLSDPKQAAALKAAAGKPGVQIMSAQKAGALFQSSNLSDLKISAALAAAQTKLTNQINPAAIPQLAVESIFMPSTQSRLTPEEKNAIAVFKTQAGITPTDEVGAMTEIKALQSAANQAGRRDGNMTALQISMKGVGDQVLQTLGGVNRVSMTFINQAIAAGKTAFSDSGEKAYAGAITSFVNDYARVINGGTGQSSDAARKEAMSMLSKADGPAAVKAAVLQLATKETSIMQQAGSQAIEMLANPNQYKSLSKIQQKAGIKLTSDDNDAAVTDPTAAAKAAGGGKVLTYDPATGTIK